MDNYEGTDPERDVTPENAPVPPPASQPDEHETSSWLARNAVYLLGLAATAGLMYYRGWDLRSVWSLALTALGLGFVIFIHELGHFLVAKWCDVHVETFSIGFGPPLPGCSFQRGETSYMIAVVPLGGYVKMVGEGGEGDEDDSDPRSFKNKSVGQRMAIISAGVVMNVILGFMCFVFVYMTRGAERRPGVIDEIESGSPAWTYNFRSGDMIKQIDERKAGPEYPYVWFDKDLLPAVMLSSEGQKLYMVLEEPNGPRDEIRIEPRSGKDDQKPVLGVAPVNSLSLFPIEAERFRAQPVLMNSAAANASPPFLFGDAIIGTTDPAKVTADVPSDNLKSVTPLPIDPRDPKKEKLDFFEFGRRLKLLIGKPIIIQVERTDPKTEAKSTVDITVPAAFEYTFGLRMRMGDVTGVRIDSPAAKAGVEKGDIIVGVEVKGKDGKLIKWVPTLDPKTPAEVEEKLLDPDRLPSALAQWAASDPAAKKKVTIWVLRKNPPPEDPNDRRETRERVKLELDWDSSFRFNKETPFSRPSPLSIPELGIAYKIETKVAGVEPGSPAGLAGFQPGDVVKAINFYNADRETGNAKAEREVELEPDQWAFVLPMLQRRADHKQLSFKVDRDGKELAIENVVATEDKNWPTDDLGLMFLADTRLQKADNLYQALTMGVERTTSFIMQIYGYLGGVLSGRLSAKQFAGPGTIASTAFAIAGSNFYQFILFLGIISVNLAVINFLPIPVLDGGHMVFLIYEKLRGKPASEQVRVAAIYTGLFLIACLMIFVIYLDIERFR